MNTTAAVRLLAGAAAVALVGGLALRDDGDSRPAAAVPTLVGLEASQIRRVVLESADRRADLVRGEGSWLAAPGTPGQAATLMFSLEDELFPLRAYRAVGGDPADPQYGLTTPEMSVTISDGSGRDTVVVVGGASFSDAGAYAHRPGRSRLYLVPRRTTDLLRSVLTGQAVASADPIAERADRYAAEREQVDGEEKVSPYLQQVLDGGGQMPPGAG